MTCFTPSRSSSSATAAVAVCRGPVLTDGIGSDGCSITIVARAARPHELLERLAGERERERVEDRPADVLERLALAAAAAARGRPSPVSATMMRASASSGIRRHETRRAVAAVTPRAMKMPPETQRRTFAPVPLRRSLPASRSASSAYTHPR